MVTSHEIYKILCQISKNTQTIGGTVTVDSSCASPLITDICDTGVLAGKLDTLIGLLQEEVLQKFDYEYVCSDEGLKISQLDTSTGATVLFNLNGTVNTTATVQACSSSVESDSTPICILGVPALMWVVKQDGVPTGTVYYTDKAGAVIPAPALTDYVLGDCSVACDPQVWSGTADNIAGIIPATSFLIYKPECCSVTLTTSVGTITIPPGPTAYSSSVFDCPITITNVTVSGSAVLCAPSRVHILINKNK